MHLSYCGLAVAQRALKVLCTGVTLAGLPFLSASGQVSQTRNVVLIVTDGLRWQEVFAGAERALISTTSGGVHDTTTLLREFWRERDIDRRHTLLPFIWSTIGREGQLYGNQWTNSPASTVNPLKFSYPGYNELFTGAYDPRIDSNDYPPNPNVTVFEWLAKQPGFQGKVAAVATWDAFRRILNRERSGIDVIDGWDAPFRNVADRTAREALIDEWYRTSVRLWPTNTFDAPMHAAAKEYIKRHHPRVLFLGYGETDEWAHAGRYDLVLHSARQIDDFIRDLWSLMQGMPEYAGSTTFIVTTDHGRGNGPSEWRNHGAKVDGAEHIWVAVLGPDTAPLGERKNISRVTQAQIAATIAALLGYDWPTVNPKAAPPIRDVLGKR